MKPFKNYILTLLLLLVFTSSNAQILHNRAFGTTDMTYPDDAAADIIITHDGYFMLYGNHYKNLYLAKSDTITQLIWEKSYPVDSILLYPSSICEIGDTSFVMSGQYQNIGFLLKVNTVGDTLYSLNDSTILGENVTNLRQAPDGNLLALVSYNNGIVSLVKFNNELSVIAKIDSATPTLKDIEVINNYIYLLKEDSLDNILVVNNDFYQLDTLDIPLYPFYLNENYLRMSFDKTQLIIDGFSTNSVLSPTKRIYIDSLGNIENSCDSLNLYFTDFQTTDNENNILYAGVHYDATWGPDIQLYFINDGCENSLKDTILYRGGTFSNPWAEEKLVKMLVDVNGNYVLYGSAEQGPLGGWDIFLMVYKKWDGFVTSVEELDNNKILSENTVSIYPNPFNDGFTLTGLVEKSEIYIVDISGKLVHQSVSTSTSTTINTTNLAKGLYIVQVKGSQHIATFKVVKQ